MRSSTSPLNLRGDGTVTTADAPIAGEEVTWDYQVVSAGKSGTAAVVTFGQVAATTVTLGDFVTTTDSTGTATNTATIVCDGCTVVFTASADDETEGGASDSAEVTVKAAGLPNTATTTSNGISTGFIATLLAVFAVIAGAGLMARQVVVNRR